MTYSTPVAGKSHDILLQYGAPGSTTTVGLMMPKGQKTFSKVAYNQFAPQARQGEATIRDLSVLTTWELNRDWSGGIGQLREGETQSNKYALSVGSPALYTGHPGRLLPPPKCYHAQSSANLQKTFKQFIMFKSGLFAVTNASTGEVYRYLGMRDWDDCNAGLTGACTQLYTNGTTLYACQGASGSVRTTTSATPDTGDWANGTANVRFHAERDKSLLTYVVGATLTPLGDFAAVVIGLSGTSATNLMWYKGSLWIGKPEGLFTWMNGRVDARMMTLDAQSTDNFSKMCIHDGLLYFNVENKLFFTDGTRISEVYPSNLRGFFAIDCLAPTFGPLLIGARYDPIAIDTRLDYQGGLFAFNGPADSGLNPYMVSTAQTTTSSTYNAVATFVDNVTGIGTDAWTDRDNVVTANGVFAECLVGVGDTTTNYLRCHTFSASLATGSVVTGVAVNVKGYKATGVADATLYVSIKTASDGPDEWISQAMPSSNTVMTFGSKREQWGLGLTEALVEATGFAVQLYIVGLAEGTYWIDHVQVVIYSYVPYKFIAAGATGQFDSTGQRVFFCESSTLGTKFLDLSTRYDPKTYTINTARNEYIELPEHYGGFKALKKWYYDCVLTIDKPNSTTYAEVWYSVDNGTLTQMQDENGAVVTLTLNASYKGLFFPLNTTGTRCRIRLYYYTTETDTAAEITSITVRGLVMPTTRYQFNFTVLCDETVMPLTGDVSDAGEPIRTHIKTACEQGYPFKIQDPDGNWWLVVNRPPSPVESVIGGLTPTGNAPERLFKILHMSLIEVDPLSSTGGTQAWTPG